MRYNSIQIFFVLLHIVSISKYLLNNCVDLYLANYADSSLRSITSNTQAIAIVDVLIMYEAILFVGQEKKHEIRYTVGRTMLIAGSLTFRGCITANFIFTPYTERGT